MGFSRDWPVKRPSQPDYHLYLSAKRSLRNLKIMIAAFLVVLVVLGTVMVVRWYIDRVDCRLDVTVVLVPFPGYESPEALEGTAVDIVLWEGGYPYPGNAVDSVTALTDDNRTAHGTLTVKSVGEWGVWPLVFDHGGSGTVLEITEADDGKTIPVTVTVVVDWHA